MATQPNKELTNRINQHFNNLTDDMCALYGELTETNPIAALYMLDQMTAVNDARSRIAIVAGLL